MAVAVIIAKNITGSPVNLRGLGVTILGGQSFTLSDFYRTDEIMEATDLAAAINAGTIIINDGTTDLSQAQSNAYLAPSNNPTGGGATSPWKAPCRAATTDNITLSGLQTIDGVVLAAADRVLVKDQATGSQNGIYVVAAGAWSRGADADVNGELVTGTAVLVGEGTTNKGTWYVATSGSIVIGTTAISFSQSGSNVTYGAVTALPLETTSANGVATSLARSDHTHGLPARLFGPMFSARATTTADITLSGTQTVDGVVLAVGDRVLVRNQAAASENGVYVVAAGAWAYAPEFITGAVVPMTVCGVSEGTTNPNTQWVLTTSGTITVGTTAQIWSMSGGGAGGSAAGAKGDVQYRGNTPGTFAASTNLNFSDTTQALTVGPTGANLTNNPFSANGNVNSWTQSNVQNLSNGTTASSDIVATADNGNDNTRYVDFGINGSGNTDGTFTVAGANDGYLYAAGGNLAIGTDSAKDLILFAGGTLAANEAARITSALNFVIGRAAKGVGDTNGFLYLGASPGAPTGIPTTIAGRIPLAIDSTNCSVYFFCDGEWQLVGDPSSLGRRAPRLWLPQTGTTIGLFGMGGTSIGTVSHPALASTNFQTQMRRARFASAASAGSFAGIRGPDTITWLGNAATLGGFDFVCRFSMPTNLANVRAFVGLYASTAALTNVDPSSLFNMIGMGLDSADANWQMMHNDQSGGSTKNNLGASFVKSTTAVYEIRMRASPNASQIRWQVTRLDAAGLQSGVAFGNIPQNTVFLTPYIWITNNAVASAAQIEMARLYLDTVE